MEFIDYMKQKTMQDIYNSTIGPFIQRIQSLEDRRKEEIRNIDNKYNTLINQEKLAMFETCSIKPFVCAHDIPVILNIRSSYSDHDDVEEACYCLTCGEKLDPNRLNTSYICLRKAIDATEVMPILNATRAKIEELWKENPNMDMLNVKKALSNFINQDLSQEQRRG